MISNIQVRSNAGQFIIDKLAVEGIEGFAD